MIGVQGSTLSAAAPPRIWRPLFWVLLLCWLAGCVGRPPEGLSLERAQRRADAELRWESVQLPDNWNRAGRAGLFHYRLDFELRPSQAADWGLYLPRVGNRFRISLNGQELGQLGQLGAGDPADYSQQAHYFHLPRTLLREGGNRLELSVEGERARYAGLSAPLIGPSPVMRAAFMQRQVLQTWGSFGMIMIGLTFGLIAGALALVQRDRRFGLFALACLSGALRTSWAVVIEPPLDFRLWALITDLSYAVYLACLCLFTTESLALRSAWIRRATLGLLLLSLVLVGTYALGRQIAARQLWTSLMLLYAIGLCATVIVVWWRQRGHTAAILSLAGLAAVGLALYDHLLVFYARDGYASFALARYSLLVFLLAMAWLLVESYARLAREQASLRDVAELELNRKRGELEQQFRRQEVLLAERAQRIERERILGDIHDGMGFQLNGLLGLVERGNLRRKELLIEVRTAIEQMRLLVDSRSDCEGSLALLLGLLRHQIERRLRQHGVRLVWQCRVEPDFILNTQQSLALQRLLFELTTNVLRHASASLVTVSLQEPMPGELELQVHDDGCGFDAQRVRAGHGMDSLQRRARELNGCIQRMEGAGTRWCLRWPRLNAELH